MQVKKPTKEVWFGSLTEIFVQVVNIHLHKHKLFGASLIQIFLLVEYPLLSVLIPYFQW